MAIAFDAFSASIQDSANLSWTHTPVGTPAGVLVFTIIPNRNTGTVDSVTYDGEPMTELTSSPLDSAGTTYVQAFFLGTGVNAGAVTVLATVSGNPNQKIGGCISVTAAGDTEVQTEATISGSGANPSGNVALSGESCFVASGIASLIDGPASITELSGWTAQLENDFGADVGCVYTYDTIGTSDVTQGFTAAAEDHGIYGVAIKESAGGGGGGEPSFFTYERIYERAYERAYERTAGFDQQVPPPPEQPANLLLESGGTDNLLLEDGSGVLKSE